MRSLITESAGYSAELIRGTMRCPRDACSAYDRRGMRAPLTERPGYYAELICGAMTCPREAGSA